MKYKCLMQFLKKERAHVYYALISFFCVYTDKIIIYNTIFERKQYFSIKIFGSIENSIYFCKQTNSSK